MTTDALNELEKLSKPISEWIEKMAILTYQYLSVWKVQKY